MMNRKGQFAERWLEYIAGALLVLGFFIAARGAYVGVTYVVALFTGALLGKFWYDCIRRHTTTLYITVLTLAVLAGMLIGSFGANRLLILLLYALGLAVSYWVHQERWIRTW